MTLNWSRVGVIRWEGEDGNWEEKLQQYPKLAEARPIVMTLEAGDVYYQPAGWAHTIQNIETSIMVNFWLSSQMIFSTAESGYSTSDRTFLK